MKWFLMMVLTCLMMANFAIAAPPLTPTMGAHLDGWLDCIPHGDDDDDTVPADDDTVDDDVEDDDFDDDADDDIDVILDQEGMFSYSYDTKETSLLFEFTNGQIQGFGLPEGSSSTRLMELNPVVCLEDYDGPVTACVNVTSFATPLVFPLDSSMENGFVVIIELTSSSGDTMRYCWGDMPQHMSYNEFLGLAQYHSSKLMVLPLDGWCPYGGCVRFVDGVPDIDNVYLQLKVAFHPADHTLLGFSALGGYTLQQLIDGNAQLVVENLNHEVVEVQKNLVTSTGNGDTFFVTVPAELRNFILRLNVTKYNGNLSWGYADPTTFQLPAELSGCGYYVFSRNSGCDSFVVAQLDSSAYFGAVIQGVNDVGAWKFIAPATFPGEINVKSLTFALNTTPGVDPASFADPVLWYIQPDIDEDGLYDPATGLVTVDIAETQDDAEWWLQPGEMDKFGLEIYVFGLNHYSAFVLSLVAVHLHDENGNPVDVANLPIAGTSNWLIYE